MKQQQFVFSIKLSSDCTSLTYLYYQQSNYLSLPLFLYRTETILSSVWESTRTKTSKDIYFQNQFGNVKIGYWRGNRKEDQNATVISRNEGFSLKVYEEPDFVMYPDYVYLFNTHHLVITKSHKKKKKKNVMTLKKRTRYIVQQFQRK